MTYDELLAEADSENLIVREKPLQSANGRIYGNRIAIRKGISSTEKTCVLAEEIGHYKTTIGNILDQSDTNNRKQEISARKWAVDKLLHIEDLFRAEAACCSTLYEVAEYLEVTEEFLLESIKVFKRRYGHSYTSGEKTIIFNDCSFYIVT